jgi:hypothetical protein
MVERTDIRVRMIVYLAVLLVAVIVIVGLYAVYLHPGRTPDQKPANPTTGRLEERVPTGEQTISLTGFAPA